MAQRAQKSSPGTFVAAIALLDGLVRKITNQLKDLEDLDKVRKDPK